jgi:hypothetical protein
LQQSHWTRGVTTAADVLAWFLQAGATARQKLELMKTLELMLVMIVAAGLAVWRGVAMYRYSFKRKNL